MKFIFFALCFAALLLASAGLASAESVLIGDFGAEIDFNAYEFAEFSGLNIVDASWNFGDETAEQRGVSVSHKYSYSGVYDIIVIALDDSGNNHSLNKKIVIGSIYYVPGEDSSLAISITDKPDGLFSLSIEEMNTSGISIEGYSAGSKFFNISTNMQAGEYMAEILLSYFDSDEDGIVDDTNIDERSLSLFIYNAGWNLIKSEVGENSNVVSANVDKSGIFTLFSNPYYSPSADNQCSTSTSSGGGGGGGGGGASSSADGLNLMNNYNNINSTEENNQNYNSFNNIDDKVKNKYLIYIVSIFSVISALFLLIKKTKLIDYLKKKLK